MRLLLRLDDGNTGKVSFQALQSLVRNGTIRGVITAYTTGKLGYHFHDEITNPIVLRPFAAFTRLDR